MRASSPGSSRLWPHQGGHQAAGRLSRCGRVSGRAAAEGRGPAVPRPSAPHAESGHTGLPAPGNIRDTRVCQLRGVWWVHTDEEPPVRGGLPLLGPRSAHYSPNLQNVWQNLILDHIAPAQYWHDPEDVQEYRGVSKFLALLNNEGNMHGSSLQSNLSKLANFVMVAWRNDTFIKPKVGKMYSISIMQFMWSFTLCSAADFISFRILWGWTEQQGGTFGRIRYL